MGPEDRARKKPVPDSLAQRIDHAIGRNLLDATSNSFLIEHPHLSRRAVERVLWQNRRKKKPPIKRKT